MFVKTTTKSLCPAGVIRNNKIDQSIRDRTHRINSSHRKELGSLLQSLLLSILPSSLHVLHYSVYLRLQLSVSSVEFQTSASFLVSLFLHFPLRCLQYSPTHSLIRVLHTVQNRSPGVLTHPDPTTGKISIHSY